MAITTLETSDLKAADAGGRALTEALDADRLDMVSELMGLASKYAAGAAIAADNRDPIELAIRARQTVRVTKEAILVLATLGKAEAAL